MSEAQAGSYLSTPFDQLAERYDRWFDRFPAVFESEVKAFRKAILCSDSATVRGLSLEVGAGTGRFAHALGIKVAIDPSLSMLTFALRRGIISLLAEGEGLPFKPDTFQLVLFSTAICFLSDLTSAFKEANRVLKAGGLVVVGFLNGSSPLGKAYFEEQRLKSPFFTNACLYTTPEVIGALQKAGFEDMELYQTLFAPIGQIASSQEPEAGADRGIFAVVKGVKPTGKSSGG